MPLVMDQGLLFPRVKGAGGGALGPTTGAFGSSLIYALPSGQSAPELAISARPAQFFEYRSLNLLKLSSGTLCLFAAADYSQGQDNTARFSTVSTSVDNGRTWTKPIPFDTNALFSGSPPVGNAFNAISAVQLPNGTILVLYSQAPYLANTASGWLNFGSGTPPATSIGVKVWSITGTESSPLSGVINWNAPVEVTNQFVILDVADQMTISALGTNAGDRTITTTADLAATNYYLKITGVNDSGGSALNNQIFKITRLAASSYQLLGSGVVGSPTLGGTPRATPRQAWFVPSNANGCVQRPGGPRAGYATFCGYSRLPPDSTNIAGRTYAFLATSPDGATWTISDLTGVSAPIGEIEPTCCELSNAAAGTIYCGFRQGSGSYRGHFLSTDGGLTRGSQIMDDGAHGTGTLNISPVLMGIESVGGGKYLLGGPIHPANRFGAAVVLGNESAGTIVWSDTARRRLGGAACQYSSVRAINNGLIGLVYESGKLDVEVIGNMPTTAGLGIQGAAFVTFNLAAVSASDGDTIHYQFNELPNTFQVPAESAFVRDFGNLGQHAYVFGGATSPIKYTTFGLKLDGSATRVSTVTGTYLNTSPVVTGLTPQPYGTGVVQYFPGDLITSNQSGIPGGTTIQSLDSQTQLTMSAAATAGSTGAATLTITSTGQALILAAGYPSGVGDQSFDPDCFAGDTGDFTVELFFKATNAAGSGVLVGSDKNTNQTNAKGWEVHVGASQSQAIFSVADGTHLAQIQTTAAHPVNDGVPHYVAFVRDVTAGKLHCWHLDANGNTLETIADVADTTTVAQNSLTNQLTKCLMRYGNSSKATDRFNNVMEWGDFRFTRKALTFGQLHKPPLTDAPADTWSASTANSPDQCSGGAPKLWILDTHAAGTIDYGNRTFNQAAPAPHNPPDGWPVFSILDQSANGFYTSVVSFAGLNYQTDAAGLAGTLLVSTAVASSSPWYMQFDASTVGKYDAISKMNGPWSLVFPLSVTAATLSTQQQIISNLDASNNGFTTYLGYVAGPNFALICNNTNNVATQLITEIGGFAGDVPTVIAYTFTGSGGSGAMGLVGYMIPLNTFMTIEDVQFGKIAAPFVAQGSTAPGGVASTNPLIFGHGATYPFTSRIAGPLCKYDYVLTDADILKHCLYAAAASQVIQTPPVGSPPLAAISGQNPASPTTVGIAVNGTHSPVDASTGSPTAWKWVLSNESGTIVDIKRTQNPTFTIATAGIYSLKLLVANGGGQSSVTISNFLFVGFNLLVHDFAKVAYTDAGATLVTSDGQQIQQINDKSGNSRNLTQATANARPIYRPSQVNGFGAMQLSADVNGGKQINSPSNYNPATPYTVFVVMKQTWTFDTFLRFSLDSGTGYIADADTANANNPRRMATNNGAGWVNGSNGPVDGTWHVAFFEFFNSAAARNVVGGTPGTGASPGAVVSTTGIEYGYANPAVLNGSIAFIAELPGTGTLATDQAKNDSIAALLRTMFGAIP